MRGNGGYGMILESIGDMLAVLLGPGEVLVIVVVTAVLVYLVSRR